MGSTGLAPRNVIPWVCGCPASRPFTTLSPQQKQKKANMSIKPTNATISSDITLDGSPFLICDTGRPVARDFGRSEKALAAHIKKGFRYVIGRRAGRSWKVGVTKDLKVTPKTWQVASEEATMYLDEDIRLTEEIAARAAAREAAREAVAKSQKS